MTTRFAKLHAEALDLADAETFANEAVHIHFAHGDLPSSFTRPQSDLLDNLGCDKRQRLARRSAAGVEMTIAFEPLPGDSPHGLNRPQLWLARSSKMDRLHRHDSMMHESPVESIAQGLSGTRHAEQIVPGAIPQDGGDDVLQVGGPVGT
jgi:hypothetical protein